jgi:hypothetical protein
MEPRRTELRHRQGQATVRVKSQMPPTSRNPFNLLVSSPVKHVASKLRTLRERFSPPPVNNHDGPPLTPHDTPLEPHEPPDAMSIDPPLGDIILEGPTVVSPPAIDETNELLVDTEEEAHIIADVQQGTWTNRTRRGTAYVEDYESDGEDEDLPGLYAAYDDEDDDIYEDVEDEEELDGGLPASDMIDEEWERELAQFGM